DCLPAQQIDYPIAVRSVRMMAGALVSRAQVVQRALPPMPRSVAQACACACWFLDRRLAGFGPVVALISSYSRSPRSRAHGRCPGEGARSLTGVSLGDYRAYGYLRCTPFDAQRCSPFWFPARATRDSGPDRDPNQELRGLSAG